MDGPAAHPLVGLMRRFCLDWLDRADPVACAEIMAEDYAIHIGGHSLTGREAEYVPGTLTQLDRFPGLMITAHEVFTDGEWVAMRFTEHGPSRADDLRPAAWTGIGLFGWNGEQLTVNVTEEDYHSRRRQLAEQDSDRVDTPATAPWATVAAPADPRAESVVRQWLAGGDLSAGGTVALDDGWTGRPTPTVLEVDGAEVDRLFSAGRDVAFHAQLHGRYAGGLPDTEGKEGTAAEMSVVGMVSVADDDALSGHVIRDRVGLRRAVRAA